MEVMRRHGRVCNHIELQTPNKLQQQKPPASKGLKPAILPRIAISVYKSVGRWTNRTARPIANRPISAGQGCFASAGWMRERCRSNRIQDLTGRGHHTNPSRDHVNPSDQDDGGRYSRRLHRILETQRADTRFVFLLDFVLWGRLPERRRRRFTGRGRTFRPFHPMMPRGLSSSAG
jgi:hypothetical protein